MKNYWLHRISHESKESDKLFKEGYLTVGWGKCKNDPISNLQEGKEAFEVLMESHGYDGRSRWGLWRFLQFRVDDIVVVPRPNSEFAICRIIEKPRPAFEIPEEVDLGFVAKIEKLKECKRSYASNPLQSRMKMRQVNGKLNDLKQHIEDALNAKEPAYVKLHDTISNIVLENRDKFMQSVTPDDLEKIIRWYMKQIGADDVYIPAKNEHGKTNHADADVIATFSKLGIQVYIQAKRHDGKTGKWAVEQIVEYGALKKDAREEDDAERENYTPLLWVISTGEFDESVRKCAKEANVRLIDGKKFFTMLLDHGIGSIDEAFL